MRSTPPLDLFQRRQVATRSRVPDIAEDVGSEEFMPPGVRSRTNRVTPLCAQTQKDVVFLKGRPNSNNTSDFSSLPPKTKESPTTSKNHILEDFFPPKNASFEAASKHHRSPGCRLRSRPVDRSLSGDRHRSPGELLSPDRTQGTLEGKDESDVSCHQIEKGPTAEKEEEEEEEEEEFPC